MATPKMLALRWLFLGLAFAAAPLSFVGCDNDRNERVISSREFIAPTLESMRLMASKLSIIRAIRPDVLDNEVDTQLARAVPLGKLGDDYLLIYESVSGSIVGIDLCAGCPGGAPVKLHWTQEALENDLLDTWGVLGLDPAFSTDTPGDPNASGVEPIALQGDMFRGWLLAYETSSGSIVAFKHDPNFRPVAPIGDGEFDPTNPPANFGSGNGVVFAVVASGSDMAAAVGGDRPRISRLFELEDGKILVFASNLPHIHLLDLTLQPKDIDADGDGTRDEEISVPRGLLRTNIPGGSFLPFKTITDNITRNSEIDLDTFQPLFVPADSSSFCEGGPLPRGGSALVFDQGSSSFLEIFEIPDPNDPSGGIGAARLVVNVNEIRGALDTAPPYFMSQGVHDNDCSAVLLFEETSNNLFRYEFTPPASESRMKVAADSVKFLLRREPFIRTGEEEIPSGEETVLTASRNAIRQNRLFFDQGRDQLIAVHVGGEGADPSYNVVIAADRPKFAQLTQRPLTNLTWIEAIETTKERAVLRVFDSESTSLLEIRLVYRPLPVEDRTR